MLQITVERLAGLEHLPPISVYCHRTPRELGISHGGIILETSGRNTAPAICLAALLANEIEPESNLLILPADHHMSALDRFCTDVNDAMTAASGGSLITFGITPNKPATGYGYIKANMSAHTPYPVIEFVEKPAQNVAQSYLPSGYSAAFFYSPAVPISRN